MVVLQFRTASDASSREGRGERKAGFDFQASIKRTGVTTQTRAPYPSPQTPSRGAKLRSASTATKPIASTASIHVQVCDAIRELQKDRSKP